MKKKVLLSSLILFFALSTKAAFAADLMDGVVKQLMEKAIYNIGSQVIDKFAPYPRNGNNYNYQQYQPASQPVQQYIPPKTTTTTPVTTVKTTNQNNDVEEQLIPVTK